MIDIEACKNCPEFKFKTSNNDLCIQCIEDHKQNPLKSWFDLPGNEYLTED